MTSFNDLPPSSIAQPHAEEVSSHENIVHVTREGMRMLEDVENRLAKCDIMKREIARSYDVIGKPQAHCERREEDMMKEEE